MYLIVTFYNNGKRIQWIELHDQWYCPKVIRFHVLCILQGTWKLYNLPFLKNSTPATNVASVFINTFIKNQNNNNNIKNIQIYDMCSGMGGPTPLIHNILRKILENQCVELQTILTDLYPEIDRYESIINEYQNMYYYKHSLNAVNINILNENHVYPKSPKFNIQRNNNTLRIRTIYEAFHHLTPDLINKILINTMKMNDNIFIGENILKRSHILYYLQWSILYFISYPVGYLYLMYYLLVENRQNKKINVFDIIFHSIIFPFSLLILMQDGVVGTGRIYTIDEMLEMVNIATKKSDNKKYEWKAYSQPCHGLFFPLSHYLQTTFLIGVNKESE